MKILSTVCSVVLLGTMCSGVSMAMDGAGEELQRARVHKQLTIQGYSNASDIGTALSSDALACDALTVRIEGSIRARSGTPEINPGDDVALLEDFFARLDTKSRPTTYSHGVYSVREAVADVARTRDGAQPSPHQINIVNRMTSGLASLDVEAMEKQNGPMACSALNILSLCPNADDLSLRFLTMDRRGAEVLQRTSRLSSLRVLEIRHAHMGDDAVAMLFAAPLPKLERLDLAHNEITGLSFRGTSFPALTTLELWHNKVGDEGLQAITESQSPSLQTLSLIGNEITANGLKTARWSDRNLKILILDCNKIGNDGARVLADGGYLPTLQALSLTYSDVGMDGLQALKTRSSIKMIGVGGAKISEGEKRQFWGTPNLFLGGIDHHYNDGGPVLTLKEIAAKYRHIKFD